MITMVYGRQTSNNVHFPESNGNGGTNNVRKKKSEDNNSIAVDAIPSVPISSHRLLTVKKFSHSSSNNNNEEAAANDGDTSDEEDSSEDEEETTRFVREDKTKRPIIVNETRPVKQNRRRHFTLGGSAEDELVVLRRPKHKKTSLNAEEEAATAKRSAATPGVRARTRNRHTLFEVGTSNGGVRSNAGGNPINFDIEAVRLDHARKVWPTCVVAGNQPPTAPATPTSQHRRPSISSEESLSDCEELGVSHHEGLEDGRRTDCR